MASIVQWLEDLGLGQYGPAFVQADIDLTVLPHLTEADLEKLGVTLGHRKKLLIAIATAAAAAAPPVAPPTPSEAEHRPITVMLCDLVGSTALASRLDPEDLREVIASYHCCAAEAVRRFDGFVAKYMGDGILVYFGYPQAHEDDAEQAVRAGLAVVAAVGDLRAPEPLRVRISIATGLVVIGDLIGTGSAQERAIIGETPNLAARLQALAEPDTIVIADSTRRQIGAVFEVVDLSPQQLKGFTHPQRAWRVLSENPSLSRFEALRDARRPLIGRGEELDLMLRRWTQAKGRRGRVVLISGEAGIGKSRLTEAIADLIAGDPHVRLRYFCSPHHQDSSFHPIVTQMERVARFGRDNPPEAKLEKLQALLGAATSPEDVAVIAELHSLPSADIAPPLNVTPEKKKKKMFEAMLRQVERISEEQPVLMVFEDIHWIDPSSRELLDQAIEGVRDWPVLLLVTFRPEFQPPWTGQPHVTVLALGRLDRGDTAALVADIAGMALPDATIREITERTEGVPLFVEELTKAVLESGTQTTPSSMPHPPTSIPTTLQASLMARLDWLGTTAKDVAQKGSVIGREFEYELLASIVDLPEPELRDSLQRLADSGLLFAHGVPPHSRYVFKHVLVQDTAYNSLLRRRRQRLHARIVTTLEERFREFTLAQPELLAYHCTEAGQHGRAVAYRLKAGRQAIGRSAMTEAVAQLRSGLDVLANLPSSDWRLQQELDLLIELRTALAATKGYATAAVGETISRARALAEEINRPEYLIPLLHGQWGFHFQRSEHRLALALAEQTESIGEARQDVTVQLLGRRAQGITRCLLGELVAARAILEQCLKLSHPAHRAIGSGLSYDPYVAMRAHLSLTLAYLGYLDQARSQREQAIAEARRLKHAHTLAVVLAISNCHDSITYSPDLRRYAEELFDLSTDHGFPLWTGWALAHRGRSLAVFGEHHAGLALLNDGLTAIRATGCVICTPLFLIWLAEGHAKLRQPGEGLSCLAEASQIIETTDERLNEAELHRVSGDLQSIIGDLSAAEQSYRDAIGIAKQQNAKLLELRALISLTRLWRDQGKRTEMRHLLTPIYTWFTEGFETPDLIEAKAMVHELEQGSS